METDEALRCPKCKRVCCKLVAIDYKANGALLRQTDLKKKGLLCVKCKREMLKAANKTHQL